ncbi:MAG: Gfo/Idh/MocA family oxidoreductase [Anaerolineales bacterium]|nr:Gfo/Idh/MocA family oxidoreductase [Anaerolineales bacterium]
MKPLGLGVLGLGEGRSIVSAGVNSALWQVICLCDLNEQLCRERCTEFGLERYTTDYDVLLADPAVDVIGIYTPDHLHAGHILRALHAGKHVICTKPLLDNLDRAQEIIAAQARSGKQVMVGQSTRFFAPFMRQRQHFETGALGDLVTIEASYNADNRWFLDKPWAKQPSFKWLYGGISHPTDLVRWYMPDVSEVMGYAYLSDNGRAGGLVNPDTYHFVLKASSSKIARISGTYSCPTVPVERDSPMTCVLRGTLGASQADYHELRYAWKVGAQATIESFEAQRGYFFRFEGNDHHAGEYQNYIEYFANCLATGVTPKPDVTEGIVTVALMQAMDQAAMTGSPVKVVDVLDRYNLAHLEGRNQDA